MEGARWSCLGLLVCGILTLITQPGPSMEPPIPDIPPPDLASGTFQTYIRDRATKLPGQKNKRAARTLLTEAEYCRVVQRLSGVKETSTAEYHEFCSWVKEKKFELRINETLWAPDGAGKMREVPHVDAIEGILTRAYNRLLAKYGKVAADALYNEVARDYWEIKKTYVEEFLRRIKQLGGSQEIAQGGGGEWPRLSGDHDGGALKLSSGSRMTDIGGLAASGSGDSTGGVAGAGGVFGGSGRDCELLSTYARVAAGPSGTGLVMRDGVDLDSFMVDTEKASRKRKAAADAIRAAKQRQQSIGDVRSQVTSAAGGEGFTATEIPPADKLMEWLGLT